ncbi:hypothetical protein CANCADRAFT_33034 [Tortispora caseinolytica NRRL Y-17796]|uniref:Uncharacterized protein n=1 Tax=Tortispora caseinolytica NRRL Y-17796 TaxID=767744 RepID=A0A1E4T9N1_9ASCO|nr:hypothetical protein CANCADRAFT_33034 [Tortispora caseinolytica NRRL Y-17796]
MRLSPHTVASRYCIRGVRCKSTAAPASPFEPSGPLPTKFNQRHSSKSEPILPPGKLTYFPSPTIANPLYTPELFIPGSEARKKNQALKKLCLQNDVRFEDPTLPPLLSSSKYTKYNVTADQVEQIRKLRAENPEINTVQTLSRQFNCSPVFISMVAPAPDSWKSTLEQKLAETKSLWTKERMLADIHRQAQKQNWLQDS